MNTVIISSMIDGQPTRAAQIAREKASKWLPKNVQAGLEDKKAYNDIIADSLLDFSGPKGAAKRIRGMIPGLTSKAATEYAVHAFAWAMEQASLEKITSTGLTHKRAIVSSGCCTVCQSNKEQGAIPVEQPFQSGHMHAPFCSRCRCATAGVRAPE